MQQGDVLLYQTSDGGEISVESGLVAMDGGIRTAAYLSLFGGNEQDSGRADSRAQWWGNASTEPDRQQRSETQYLLRSIPAITANLLRIQQAALRDLSWFVDDKIATDVSVTVSMPGLNRVEILVEIDNNGEKTEIKFLENWRQREQ